MGVCGRGVNGEDNWGRAALDGQGCSGWKHGEPGNHLLENSSSGGSQRGVPSSLLSVQIKCENPLTRALGSVWADVLWLCTDRAELRDQNLVWTCPQMQGTEVSCFQPVPGMKKACMGATETLPGRNERDFCLDVVFKYC